ncbi:coiled-coil domain-containing protein 38 [Rhinolophus ferrumequinum]|uniref:coiled-coil domain-containing protein 38 n=1 Tax=Rhinolophus ferrumequinum TaxID=59479 RepID=UPI00140FEB27|nr:coiled-coil domain-containing protein 38 [Rhinolophus ferrumequinum]
MLPHLSPIPLTPEEKLKDDSLKKERPYRIFFKDLFLYKEDETTRKKENFSNRNMKVHQKSTFSSRMKSRSHLSQIMFYSDTVGGSLAKFELDPTLILRLTEGKHKKTVHEFINDQRDRFLLEYALSTKRNTITKFDKYTATKERQLLKAETKLQEDAMAFEEFLRENDQRSVDALKIAAQETINKLQMMAELKKASMEVQAVKSEISKTEFLLREYMKYGFFLLKLSPKQWQIQQALRKAKMSKSKENMSGGLAKRLTKLNTKKKQNSGEGTKGISFIEDYPLGKGSQGNVFCSRSQSQEKLIDSLSKKINQVYKVCIGDGDVGSLDPIQKLVKVESRLVELSDLMETVPKENVEAIERIKQKERRQKLREEKMKEKQRHQEERLKAALERAVAQPKKKLGRRLVYRSKPPSSDKQELFLIKDTKTKPVEDEYFFT